MKPFRIVRMIDPYGMTNAIAEGVIFNSGKVVFTWLTDIHSLVMFDSIDNVIRLYCNNGMNYIEY